jgi:hypothetical protein
MLDFQNIDELHGGYTIPITAENTLHEYIARVIKEYLLTYHADHAQIPYSPVHTINVNDTSNVALSLAVFQSNSKTGYNVMLNNLPIYDDDDAPDTLFHDLVELTDHERESIKKAIEDLEGR